MCFGPNPTPPQRHATHDIAHPPLIHHPFCARHPYHLHAPIHSRSAAAASAASRWIEPTLRLLPMGDSPRGAWPARGRTAADAHSPSCVERWLLRSTDATANAKCDNQPTGGDSACAEVNRQQVKSSSSHVARARGSPSMRQSSPHPPHPSHLLETFVHETKQRGPGHRRVRSRRWQAPLPASGGHGFHDGRALTCTGSALGGSRGGYAR